VHGSKWKFTPNRCNGSALQTESVLFIYQKFLLKFWMCADDSGLAKLVILSHNKDN